MRRRQQKIDSEDAFNEFLAEQPGVWPELPHEPDATDALSEFETEGGPDQWLIAARGKPPATVVDDTPSAPIVHHTPHVLVVAAVFLSLFTPAGLISTVIVSRHLNVSPMQVVDASLPPLPPSLLDASAVQPIRLASSRRLPSLPAPSVDVETAPAVSSAPARSSPNRSTDRAPSLPVSTPAPGPLLPLTTALLTTSRPVEDKPNAPAPVPPPVPAASPVAVPETPTATRATGPSAPDEAAEAVRAALNRYRNALSNLDASGAKAVWPDVDEKMLTRAFSQLEQQLIVFDACNIDVAAARATASCNGRAQFVPKVGSRTPRFESRQWTFTLNRGERDWKIQSVTSR
jgi:hypothetical protein